MKILNLTKLFVALLLLAIAPMRSSATTLYSFLSPVRSEITNQLHVVTNTVPLDRVLTAKLKAGLKSIDRPTATNLTVDVQALNALVIGLGKSSLSNTFLPLLNGAGEQYFDLLVTSYSSLTNQLTTALPSGMKTAASNNLAQLIVLLQKASTNNLAGAVKLMGQAVAKTKVSTTLVTKANAVTAVNTFTATIGGTAYVVRGLLGGTHATGVLGNYSDANHILTIGVNKLVGANAKNLTIDVGPVTEGTTVHNFGESGADAIAAYIIAGLGGNGVSNSTGGTITVTMNSDKRVMTGSFSFTIAGTAGNSTVTGTFLVNY